jgi:predicted Co/Zn/Cd cation transporter (cation efflux family)
LLGFVWAWWLENISLLDYATRVDPLLLIILGLAVLLIPGKVMIDSLKGVINQVSQPQKIFDVPEYVLDAYTLHKLIFSNRIAKSEM